jgi:DNA-binding NarL/FixJ family response regulator
MDAGGCTLAVPRSSPPDQTRRMLSPATGMSPLCVLIVDADRRVRDSLCDLLRCETRPVSVDAVSSPEEALARVANSPIDVVVIDPHLPDLAAGLGLIADLRAEHPAIRLLVMTWSADVDGVAHGADGLLDKAASPEDLVAAISDSARRGGTT